MQKLPAGDIFLYQFGIFFGQTQLSHFVTDRHGGISTGPFESLNVSVKSGDLSENAFKNRQIIAKVLKTDADKLLFPEQVHGDTIKIAGSKTAITDLAATDALITSEKGICIAVMCADCVPVLLYDPEKNVAAAIHAGWKGTVMKITAKTAQKMQEIFGCDPAKIVAGIGPSISQQNYEVGSEVMDKFRDSFQNADDFIRPVSKTHGLLDLWKANRLQLLDCGLRHGNIETAGICTFADTNFYSARRQGVKCGRFAAGIMLA